MNESRKNLIADLAADATAVRRPGRIGGAAVLWLGAALAYSVAILLATGPLRPDAVSNLGRYPFFAIETAVAAVTIVALLAATLMLAVPGRGLPRSVLVVPLALFGSWLAFYVVGFWQPAHPASTLGARDHCVLQGILFGLPNLLILLLVARRFYPLWPRLTGATAGLAAGAIPAALMQFGCMYLPFHILTEHMGPVLVTAGIGAVAGPLFLAPRRIVPGRRGTPLH